MPGLIDIGVEDHLSRVNNGEPFYLDNAGSHAHLPGMDWDDDTHTNNGHFAPFAWNGSAPPVAYRLDRRSA